MGVESFNDPKIGEIERDYKKEQEAIAGREQARHKEIGERMGKQQEEANKNWLEEHPLTPEPQKTPEMPGDYIEINSEEQVKKYGELKERTLAENTNNETSGVGYINERGEFVRGKDAPKQENITEESDSFESFYKDPVAKNTLEKVALEYLRTQDRVYFDREFTGELDSEGYLIRRDGGKPTTKPSMNITGKGIKLVIEKVKSELGQ